MRTLSNILKRLGWPVEEMSFRQIARELYQRWFQSLPDAVDAEKVLGTASATGIVLALANEGGLDALSWSRDSADLNDEAAFSEAKALFFRSFKDKPGSHPERRSAPRKPGKDVVCWTGPGNDSGTGWLVDYSTSGIAFITEKERALQVGTRLWAAIQSRSNKTLRLGKATVVRVEPLTPELSLACLQLESEGSKRMH